MTLSQRTLSQGTLSQPITVPDIDAVTMAPSVAAALAVWDTLALELGEMAVVVDGHRLSRLTALAATWYGALPVLFLTKTSAEAPAGTTLIPISGSDEQARELASLMRKSPGVAAAELSGTADAVDLLLESVPPSSRLLLAGDARERLTIDYYVNVHRKGLRLVSDVLSDQIAPDAAAAARLDRAHRILARPAFANACRAALGLR